MISPTVPGLSASDQELINNLFGQLAEHSFINRTRREYFEAKQRVRQLGIAIPPQLSNFETALGWPYKAVKALASRIRLDGFTLSDGSADELGVDRIWAENRLGREAHHAHMSALTYGVSFVTVLAGGAGEPDVVIRALSPLNTTAFYDANQRRVKSAITITGEDNGQVTEFILFTDERVITCRSTDGAWSLEESPTMGRCPVVMLAYDASPEYPFGRSRITQGVMKITDEAIRTSLRMEVSAEFYSSPQRYILGADEQAFRGPDGRPVDAWSAVTGRVLALGLNEIDESPTVGQFQQMTMQPHADMFRMIAAKFSGETSLPTHTLGLLGEQPDSEEAIKAKYLELAADAEAAHEEFGAAWVSALRMAVEIASGVPFEDSVFLQSKWRSAMYESKAAAADFTVKLVQVGVLPSDSDVTLEQMGFDQVTIDRVKADRRRSAVSQLVSGIQERITAGESSPEVMEQANAGTDNAASSVEDPAVLRQKFEALGVAIRAGVEPQSAAMVLGLVGVEFTGAVPVSLRVPETEARRLEEQ